MLNMYLPMNPFIIQCQQRLNCIDASLVQLSDATTTTTTTATTTTNVSSFLPSPSPSLLLDMNVSREGTSAKSFLNSIDSKSSDNSFNATTTTNGITYDNIVTTKYAPITLEKQFLDLYRLFRPALIVHDSDSSHHDHHSSDHRRATTITTTTTTTTSMNASAFIIGPRGSGKSILVQRVIQSIVDELYCINQHRGSTTASMTSTTKDNKSCNSYFRYVYINGLLIPGYSIQNVVREILYQLIASGTTPNHGHSNCPTRNNSNSSSNIAITSTDNKEKKKRKRDTTDDNQIYEDNHGSDDQQQQDEPPKWVQQLEQYKYQQYESTTTTATATRAPPQHQPTGNNTITSNFTNQLQLLNEIIEVASIGYDHIPILFVLDELDTFVASSSSTTSASSLGSSNHHHHHHTTSNTSNNTQMENALFSQERQLLLYHLLERVTKPNSCVNVIGITSDTSIMMKLEKRIKSRIEGTTKFIMTPSVSLSYENSIINILSHKIIEEAKISSSLLVNKGTTKTPRHDDNDKKVDVAQLSPCTSLREEISNILHAPKVGGDNINNKEETTLHKQRHQRLYDSMQRNYRLGKDVRWFCRVVYIALSYYRNELQQRQQQLLLLQDPANSTGIVSNSCTDTDIVPAINIRYFEEALVDMGGSIINDVTNNRSTDSNNNRLAIPPLPEPDIRIRTIQDMTGPQIALVFAARRILIRDSCNNTYQQKNQGTEAPSSNNSSDIHPQLSLRRILYEYQSSYKGLTSKYTTRILRQNFIELYETGIFRPSMDHTGIGPFQYQFRESSTTANNHTNNVDVLDRIPLHMTLDIHCDIQKAIDNNLFHCSTALREWGRKTN